MKAIELNIHWGIIFSAKMMILRPVPYLGVSYANDPPKGAYIASAPTLDLTTLFEVISVLSQNYMATVVPDGWTPSDTLFTHMLHNFVFDGRVFTPPLTAHGTMFHLRLFALDSICIRLARPVGRLLRSRILGGWAGGPNNSSNPGVCTVCISCRSSTSDRGRESLAPTPV